MEKMNREQRRREKYGHAGGATKDPWPQSEANPIFGQVGDAGEETGKATGDEATAPAVPDEEPAAKAVPVSRAVAKKTSKSGASAKASKSGDSAKVSKSAKTAKG